MTGYTSGLTAGFGPRGYGIKRNTAAFASTEFLSPSLEAPLSEGGVWEHVGASTWFLQKNNGVAQPEITSVHCRARRVTPIFKPNQRVKGRKTILLAQYPGIMSRVQADGAGYVLFMGSSVVTLYRVDAAENYFQLLNFPSVLTPIASNFELWSVGNTHTVYLNGVNLGSAIDGTHGAGQPGADSFAANAGDADLDYWEAADV